MEKLTTKNFAIAVMIICFLAILITVKVSAQLYTAWGAGYDQYSSKPCYTITAGALKDRIMVEGMINAAMTRKANSNHYFGFNAGYEFKYIIPFAGYYYNLKNSDNKDLNKWNASIGIRGIYPVKNNNGWLFINGFYANGFNVTAGLQAVF